MTLGRETPIFFDASCLFVASDPPSGGSAFLLHVCRRGFLRAAASLAVLMEAENNILGKRSPQVLARFHRLLADTPFLVVPAPSKSQLIRFHRDFLEDDHVVAAGTASQIPFLITLDKRLERRVRQANLSFTAVSPRDFIQAMLPTHRDFLRIEAERGTPE